MKTLQKFSQNNKTTNHTFAHYIQDQNIYCYNLQNFMPHLASNHLIITEIFVLHYWWKSEKHISMCTTTRRNSRSLMVGILFFFSYMYLNNKLLTIEIFSNMLLLFNTHNVISFLIYIFFAPRLKDFIFISALGKHTNFLLKYAWFIGLANVRNIIIIICNASVLHGIIWRIFVSFYIATFYLSYDLLTILNIYKVPSVEWNRFSPRVLYKNWKSNFF